MIIIRYKTVPSPLHLLHRVARARFEMQKAAAEGKNKKCVKAPAELAGKANAGKSKKAVLEEGRWSESETEPDVESTLSAESYSNIDTAMARPGRCS